MTISHGHRDLVAEKVYIGGGYEVDEANAEAAVGPGHLVVRGAAAGDIVEAGDGALNVLGYALENDLKADDASMLTDYAIGEAVKFNEARSYFAPVIANAVALQHGDLLVAAAGGEVRKYAPQTDLVAGDPGGAVVAKYVGHADLTGDGAKRGLCIYLGGL